MIKKLFFLAALLAPCLAYGGNPSADLSGQVVPAAPSSVCSNPAVPSPAQAAGFTTLAYCADFTQQASSNNVLNGTPRIEPWTTMAWLDCNGTQPAGAQWVDYTGTAPVNNQPENPCSAKTIAVDPATGTKALLMLVTPTNGDPTTHIARLGITTAIDPCSNSANPCYEVFPITNMYAEINWRQDITAVTNFVTSQGNVVTDFWSWWANTSGSSGGCLEVDFIELFSAHFSSNGIVNYDCGGTLNPWNPANFTFDSNYHTDGALSTSDRTTKMAECSYHDGVASPSACNIMSGAHPAALAEQGYISIWNLAGFPTPASGDVPLYVAWVRVWSCSGWNTTGDPRTTANTCNTASPFTTAP
jgi:hypothetical protein